MARKLVVEIIGDSSSLERSFSKARSSTNQFERETTRAFRGVAAGSGVFRSLGRSIAFASGTFLGFATAGQVIRGSIDAATEAAATQRQLAATFKATGTPLEQYRARIDATANRLSRLAGIENDQIIKSFNLAFRATRNVTESLRIAGVAADVAAGRNVGLTQATLAVTKGVTQNATALRRLGVAIPANIKGFQVLDFVQRRFAGQAAAGATAQERLAAAVHNTEEIIGAALLPTVNRLENSLSLWLSKTQNQKRLQADVAVVVRDTAAAVNLLADAFQLAGRAADGYMKIARGLGTAVGPLGETFKVLLIPGFGLNKALKIGQKPELKPVIQVKPQFVFGGLPYANITGVVAALGFQIAAAFHNLASGAAGGTVRPRFGVGIITRGRQLDLAFAQAQLTGTSADDRRILVAQAANIRAQIARANRLHKDLQTRTALYQQLAGIEQQITAIDQAQADAIKADRDKQKAARQATMDRLRQAYTDAITTFRDAFKTALDDARNTIGQLFAGPVLAPSADALKARLGVRIAGTQVGSLTADLNAQVRQAAQFFRDLNRIRARGGSAQLVSELQAGGDVAQAHALAGAGPGAFRAFLAAFRARERLAQHVAIQTPAVRIAAQHVTLTGSRLAAAGGTNVYVYVDGHKVPATVKTTQRRGRHAGTRG